MAFLRKDKKGSTLVTVCNFSPVDRTGYTIGVPTAGTYTCLFSTDDPPSADWAGAMPGRSRASISSATAGSRPSLCPCPP
ncbi:alpha amylase C-terminal domain-containing protein [Flavonifractor plautii]|nr:alpha amylase C-terminal domain-containing protein [Flavonifractor plautii]